MRWRGATIASEYKSAALHPTHHVFLFAQSDQVWCHPTQVQERALSTLASAVTSTTRFSFCKCSRRRCVSLLSIAVWLSWAKQFDWIWCNCSLAPAGRRVLQSSHKHGHSLTATRTAPLAPLAHTVQSTRTPATFWSLSTRTGTSVSIAQISRPSIPRWVGAALRFVAVALSLTWPCRCRRIIIALCCVALFHGIAKR